jgi:hypothetical protein
MGLSTHGETNEVQYGVYFGGVSNTESHRRQYDTASMLHATRTNGLWMVEIDLGETLKESPNWRFGMYYASESNPWGIRIPYRGTKAD